MYKLDRKCNAIIQGILSQENENLLQLVKSVAAKVNVDIQDYHVCAVHPLPSKKEVEPIIIRFNNFQVKKDLISNTKPRKLNARELGMGSHPIFILY